MRRCWRLLDAAAAVGEGEGTAAALEEGEGMMEEEVMGWPEVAADMAPVDAAAACADYYDGGGVSVWWRQAAKGAALAVASSEAAQVVR